MRVKDEEKQEALFEATITIVNQIGFASSSVSKIAQEAGISPATIYIYYKNKEDLLISIYSTIKKNLSRALLRDFDDNLPIRDILKKVWLNGFDYISKHPRHFHYTEQFANSPFADVVDKTRIEKYYEPLMLVFQRGIDQKILKDVDYELLTTFMFYPIMILCNRRLCSQFEMERGNFEQAFGMAWDAIKL